MAFRAARGFRHTAWPWSRLAIVCCALVLSGCGGKPEVKFAPVKGIVLYNAKPLEGATVEFLQEGSPMRSVGLTDAAGRFELTSMVPGDGAPIGENQATV